MKTMLVAWTRILFAALVVLGLCANALGAKEIRMGVLPVVDTLPLIVAEERGWFTEQGLQVELVPFQSALERDAALQAGKIDGYFGDILNSVLLINAGLPVKIITTAFEANKEHRMFGIAAAPGGAKSLAGLEHGRVAISRATIIEYLLDRMMAHEGRAGDFLKKEEIKKMPIRLQMLLESKIESALLPEPLLSMAELNGAVAVMDDRGLDTAETVLGIDVEKVDSAAIDSFLRAYDKAAAAINKDPESFKATLVEKTRFPAPVKDKYRVPSFPLGKVPSEKDIEDVQEWLVRQGMMEAALPYGKIVYKAGRRLD